MGSADVYEFMRVLLRGALEQVAAAEESAHLVLERVRALDRPQTWADVLVFVLVRLAAEDPRLSVSADAETVTLTFTDAGGRACVALAAFGPAPPAVVVTVDGDVRLDGDTLDVTAQGRGRWRLGLHGPDRPEGDARCVATARVPVGRAPALAAGVTLWLGEHLTAGVRLATAAPVWTVDVRAPAVSARVSPGALLGMPDDGGPALAFAPVLHAEQGGAAALELGAA